MAALVLGDRAHGNHVGHVLAKRRDFGLASFDPFAVLHYFAGTAFSFAALVPAVKGKKKKHIYIAIKFL